MMDKSYMNGFTHAMVAAVIFIVFPYLVVPILIGCGIILLFVFMISWLFQLPLPPSPFASSPADIAQNSSAATSPEDPPNKVRL